MDLFAALPVSDTPLSDAEKRAWLRLIRSQNIGPITFYKLIQRYGAASKALEMLPELSHKQKKDTYICSHGDAEREMERISRFGAQLLFAGEEDYPLALAALEDAPPVLTVSGDTSLLHRPSIGMVGARNASHNGRRFAQVLANDLGKAGQVVISGLARGIDTSAHQGSLEHGTVAVIAGGIDVIYPEENTGLYQQIREKGCVVAESPFGQKPFSQSFPRRNRIISGLSAGVVVVEASIRSGSLITARMAAEQGRDVFAVPGFPLDPRAAGPNKLLRDGAVLVEKAEDILEHVQLFRQSGSAGFNISHMEDAASGDFVYEEDDTLTQNASDAILKTLSSLPVQIDDLFRDLHLSPAAGNSALLELEITGQIKRSAGGKVSLVM